MYKEYSVIFVILNCRIYFKRGKKVLKKSTICFILFFLMLTSSVSAQEIRVFLNNKEILFETPPEILNDRTMVPMRKIFEEMGMVVQWDYEQSTAVAFNDSCSLSFAVGNPYMSVNGEVKILDTVPVILNSYMYVPVRAIAEASGCGIDWDGEEKCVRITSASFQDLSLWPKEVMRLTNEIREEHGLCVLEWNDTLAKAAYKHSLDMVNRNFFDHENPDGESPIDRIRNEGLIFFTAAENIAAGQSSPQAVVKAWMESEGHRANILNPDLKQIGVGVARGGIYGIYWTQNFASTY